MNPSNFLNCPGRPADPDVITAFHNKNEVLFQSFEKRIRDLRAGHQRDTRTLPFPDFHYRDFERPGDQFIGALVTQFDYKPQNSFQNFIQRINDYLVCLKSDGTRFLLAIFSSGRTFMFERQNKLFEIRTNLFTKFIGSKVTQLGDIEYILDGELTENKSPYRRHERYHFQVFDCILSENQILIDKPLFQRLEAAQLLLKKIEFFTPVAAEQKMNKMTDSDIIYVYLKDFYPATQTEFLLKKLSKIDLYSNNIDGLIFTKNYYPYLPGRNIGMIKWKPESLNTIDFLVVDNPDLLKNFQVGGPTDTTHILELYVSVKKEIFILFDYLFIFSEDDFIETCSKFRTMKFGETTVEAAIVECHYNKVEDHPAIKLFYDAVYTMSSDALVSLINSCMLKSQVLIDHEAMKWLLTAFEQRRSFGSDTIRGNWQRLRFRDDKEFPNGIRTVASVHASIFEKPIPDQKLIDEISKTLGPQPK